MPSLVPFLFVIPLLPLAAAAALLCMGRSRKGVAAPLAIAALAASWILSLIAFGDTLGVANPRWVFNFPWLPMGGTELKLGWMLDPLTAAMLVMVTFVGTLIFIFSAGYMAEDPNFTGFFCSLSLFAAAMLGLVIANSLLLLFISWELVGLASYLLIGFWHHKPSAAAAAKKAFITTRVGDLCLFIGLLWLFSTTGTLLMYDNGRGCLESQALQRLGSLGPVFTGGPMVATAIALLIFCGAVGKSGQVPLHVWLPDAMEGPTPVSALIHAATMVAAGVFLVARVFPLMAIGSPDLAHPSAALTVVTWVGAITALMAAAIAVAQTDIKRILAYSTVSQLGYMMMGLGTGGVAVGMFHLITHAFFKALLFLGAGSVIHGCHEEQDIRKMGGLRKWMPVTFATYAAGMMALTGVPLFFSGFWSKDEILHSALQWPVSSLPFVMGLLGAFLTSFYMGRQTLLVFFGESRAGEHAGHAHESPPVMTVPLAILAFFAVALGFVGTPAWPWFQGYLVGHPVHFEMSGLIHALGVMGISTVVVLLGLGGAWWLYGQRPMMSAEDADPLERKMPEIFNALRNKLYWDELYAASVIAFHAFLGRLAASVDRYLWNGVVQLVAMSTLLAAWVSRLSDEFLINLGFDRVCRGLARSGLSLSRLQDGQIQNYLRALAVALTVLVLLLTWGCSPP
jgi:NADH-quinone oxidoreductase subunit L